MPSKNRKPLTREQKDAHNERCRKYNKELRDKVSQGDEEAIKKLEIKRITARLAASVGWQERRKAADNGDEEALAYIAKNRESSKERFKNISREERDRLNQKARKKRAEEKELFLVGDESAIAKRKNSNEYHCNKGREKALARKQDPIALEKYREKERARSKRKYHTDPQHKLRILLRTRVKRALKGGVKPASVLKVLGCTVEELKNHIESQWQPWMNWTNQGCHVPGGKRVWHIDHIKPLKSFDLTDINQMTQACHFSNLRPLEGVENLKKHAKLDYEFSS